MPAGSASTAVGGLLAASTSTTRGAAAEFRTAQGCQPHFTQGCQPRFAQGCQPRIAQGCLVLRIAWGCLVLRITAGSTVAGAPPRGAAGFEEWGGGPETCSHCSTCAARDTVAGAPKEGAAGYKVGGRSGDDPPSSLPADRTTLAGGARLGTINVSADSISAVSWEAAGIVTSCRRMAGVCHPTVSITVDSLTTCGPLEASSSGPGLCAGLLGF
ncbi:UNVERIFIED_CONTAM: hypothetical protein FKN15_014313 [Acipenser sinensis]